MDVLRKQSLMSPAGEIVQFERVGFVRLEKQQTGLVGFFTHK